MDDLNLVFGEVQELARRYDHVAAISLLDPGCRPPTNHGREVLAKHQARLADSLVIANLVDGQGFWASIVLNALVGIQTMKSKRSQSERVFRRRQDACIWLQEHVDGQPLPHELARVIQYCRSPDAESHYPVALGA